MGWDARPRVLDTWKEDTVERLRGVLELRRSEVKVRRGGKGGRRARGEDGWGGRRSGQLDRRRAPRRRHVRESDIGRPRTNPEQAGKRAPEAVRWSKTGHTLVTSQRQLNKPPCRYGTPAVDISPHASPAIKKIHLRDSPWPGLSFDTNFGSTCPWSLLYSCPKNRMSRYGVMGRTRPKKLTSKAVVPIVREHEIDFVDEEVQSALQQIETGVEKAEESVSCPPPSNFSHVWKISRDRIPTSPQLCKRVLPLQRATKRRSWPMMPIGSTSSIRSKRRCCGEDQRGPYPNPRDRTQFDQIWRAIPPCILTTCDVHPLLLHRGGLLRMSV